MRQFTLRQLIALTALCSPLIYAGNGTLLSPYKTSDCTTREHCPAGVYSFDVHDNQADIQKTIDAIYQSFSSQAPSIYTPESEWSDKRFALLFHPGNYPQVNLKVNYYTQILGLGRTPQEASVNSLFVDNLCFPGSAPSCKTLGALNNFWRGVENISFKPDHCAIPKGGIDSDKCIVWNVSQAAPIRNVHVDGDLMLNLAGCFNTQGQCSPPNTHPQLPNVCTGAQGVDWVCGAGFGSGGFMANATVTGDVYSISQQQWFTRNSQFRQWHGGVWNMVFVQTQGQLPTTTPNTIQTPRMVDSTNWPVFAISSAPLPSDIVLKEKPYLYTQGSHFHVMVPGTQPTTGENYPLSEVVVMNKDNQEVHHINAQLAHGDKKGLLIEPGIYNVATPIEIPEGKFVLGLGMAELVCTSGNHCLKVSGKNARVAGVMVAAGCTGPNEHDACPQSESLVQVTKALGNAANAQQATYLYDVFCRVAENMPKRRGAGVGPSTKNCITIDTDYTVGDNLWLWRADHDRASSTGSSNPLDNLVKWHENVTEHGLSVTGNHVSMFGLFSEHHNASNVHWLGDHGRTYFYQSEFAYDAPHNWQCPDFQHPDNEVGCPSYMIGKDVHHHFGLGLAIYTFFQDATMAHSAIRMPFVNGIELRHIVGRYLNNFPLLESLSGFTYIIADYTGQTSGGSHQDGANRGAPQSENDPQRLPARGLFKPDQVKDSD